MESFAWKPSHAARRHGDHRRHSPARYTGTGHRPGLKRSQANERENLPRSVFGKQLPGFVKNGYRLLRVE